MHNLYVAFLVYLNLIFVAAKLWGQIEWSWLWVMSPLIAITIIGLLGAIGQRVTQNRTRSDIVGALEGVRNLIEQAKKKREEENNRTIN